MRSPGSALVPEAAPIVAGLWAKLGASASLGTSHFLLMT